MLKLSFLEIQEQIKQFNLEQLPMFKISILRNITLESLEPYLKYLCFQIGLNCNVSFGKYDNIFQEAVSIDDRFINMGTDCVSVFLKLENLSWDLSRNFTGLSSKQIQVEVDRIKKYITTVLLGIRKKTNAMILWHGFEMPVFPNLGIYDSQIRGGQVATVRSLNEFIITELLGQKNAYFLDLNLCLTRVGFNQFYDFRYWHIGKAPYSREALREIALESFKFISSSKGQNKKCLVLDCDNVLWGGIVGEDGLGGVKLGKTYPGSQYYEFQQEVLNLYRRGIIIGLCSKNNENDVWEVFHKHPEMILRKTHISVAKINWDDKVINIKNIAKDLNISLDSLVFVDDSEFEINMVKNLLPEVETLHLPSKRSFEYRNMLSSSGFFDSLNLSSEDKRRGILYKKDVERKKASSKFNDVKSYYGYLEMVVTVDFADELSIARISQLTQRTNQFNLTTKRYSEADIKAFSVNIDSDVLYLQLKDRFGDMGIVGVCILVYGTDKALLDTFLMSCRVIGRCVENVFINCCLILAQKRGKIKAVGEFCPTRKNNLVKNFYNEIGFNPLTHDENNMIYECDLETYKFSKPDFSHKVIFNVGENIRVPAE